MYLIHYYLQRGHDIKRLCNLDAAEKLFYGASILVAKNEEYRTMSAMLGGGMENI